MSSETKQYDPVEIIGEILGLPAHKRPIVPEKKANQTCAFSSQKCTKQGRPICSFWERSGHTKNGYSRRIVATCPKRFSQVDFLRDIVETCWPTRNINRVKVLSEVNLPEFGRLDYVITHYDDDGNIDDFLPVEVQAVDISTPEPLNHAYSALLNNRFSEKNPTTNGNWDNVYKRYVTQLVRKGFVANSWGTKIVAVIQDQFYNYMFSKYPFMKGEAEQEETNILFFNYKITPTNPIRSGSYIMSLDEVVGTNHASLQSAYLYKKAPSREEFVLALDTKIIERQKKQRSSTKSTVKQTNSNSSIFQVLTASGE